MHAATVMSASAKATQRRTTTAVIAIIVRPSAMATKVQNAVARSLALKSEALPKTPTAPDQTVRGAGPDARETASAARRCSDTILRMARVVWVATGMAWAFRSLLDLLSPRYFHPVSPLDYLAVWSFTAALLLTGPAVVCLSRLSWSRSVRVIAIATGAGAVLAGLANAAEDALRVRGIGDIFVAGMLVLVAGLLACTAILAIFRNWRLAAAFALLSAGVLVSFALPGGGLLVLLALLAVAARPAWFTVTPGDPPDSRRAARR
ncbi:hypothetical protein ACH3VR_04355 [Microbacterium sp. B2969]|uniref:Uncharacterized protein n=1 Tax=Microbacterium alkaliflavum TaxID=3248839 RepID=A0ABW7Q601_9MICO